MEINNIIIENFRSIRRAKFIMRDITAIVGQNNAGKTAILRAINSFFNFEQEEKFFYDKTHKYGVRKNTHITLTFSDIPKESEVLKNYIYNDEIKIKFTYEYSKNKRTLQVLMGNKNEKVGNFDNIIREIKKYIIYAYIPSERTNNDIVWDEKSIFYKLITSYFNNYTQNRDNISSDVRKSGKKIHDTILKKLEKNINQLYMQNENVKFRIDFPLNIDYSIMLKSLDISIFEGDRNRPLKEWGSGTKSLTIISMYRAYALIEGKNIILGIEEPETNLHPQAQRRFINMLLRGREEKEVQAIFTTHSTVLVDELKHENILLVRKKRDLNGEFSVVSQIPEEFMRKYKINEEAHYNFFNFKNSDFFFSKYVIICESSIDIYIIKKIISKGVSDERSDISFIALDGVKNLSYPYHLLKELSIPFSVVVDYDFFYPYKVVKNSEGKEKNERNKKGFPLYEKKIKDIGVIDSILGNDKNKLLNIKGYRKFFDIIKKKNIFSMMYSLEIDLLCSKAGKNLYYNRLQIPKEEQTEKKLLINHKTALKKRENILYVVDNLETNQYPESYKKIKNEIIKKIKEIM